MATSQSLRAAVSRLAENEFLISRIMLTRMTQTACLKSLSMEVHPKAWRPPTLRTSPRSVRKSRTRRPKPRLPPHLTFSPPPLTILTTSRVKQSSGSQKWTKALIFYFQSVNQSHLKNSQVGVSQTQSNTRKKLKSSYKMKSKTIKSTLKLLLRLLLSNSQSNLTQGLTVTLTWRNTRFSTESMKF